jgi:phosphoribosyl 1,2-cyclic phosphodiesterase
MFIRCWGARGSIPVSGKEYLKYGGDTTCIEIRTKNDAIIIIDAGSGIRKLGNSLIEQERYEYTMIFTHAHWDHLLGFPFFKPIYHTQTHIRVFGCPFAQKTLEHMIGKAMEPPNFPVNYGEITADISHQGVCCSTFTVDSVDVTPIQLSHPNNGLGYRFTEDGKVFVFLTDNELTYTHPGGLDIDAYVDFSADADLLIHDAEFTREDYTKTKTWGHTVYNDALSLALRAHVKRFGLFHHNQDRSDLEIDEIVNDCRETVIQKRASCECFAVFQGFEHSL